MFVRFVITNIRNFFRYASIFVDKNKSFFSFPVFTDVLGHKKNGSHVWEPLKQETKKSSGRNAAYHERSKILFFGLLFGCLALFSAVAHNGVN